MKVVRSAATGAWFVSVLMAWQPGAAQTVKDAPLTALFDAGCYREAATAASVRIAARPDDMDGYAALKQLEARVARLPQAAMCHYGVGSVLGAQSLSQGMLRALSSAGRVRESLARSVELDPLLYAARNALVQFYPVVPGIAGGSVAKAREVANAVSVRQPEHASTTRKNAWLRWPRPAEAPL